MTSLSGLNSCSNGAQVSGEIKLVELSGVAKQVRILFKWTVTRNGCSSSISSENATVTAPLKTIPYVLPAAAQNSPYFLYVAQDAGESSSGLKTWAYDQTQGDFNGYQSGPTLLNLRFKKSDQSDLWSINMISNNGGPLQVGSYADTPSTASLFQSVSSSFIQAVHTGDSVNVTNPMTHLDVTRADYDAAGNLLRFEASFFIDADPWTGIPRRGYLKYDSTQTFASYQPPSDTTSSNLLYLNGPGAQVPGQTSTLLVNQTMGSFWASGQNVTGASIGVTYRDSTGFFRTVNFTFPNGTLPVPGLYTGATGGVPRAASQPGLSLGGGSSFSCGTQSTGQFRIIQADFDSNQIIRSFVANFELHCDLSSSPLRGTVRYNSPAVPQPTYSGPPNTTLNNYFYSQSYNGDPIGKGGSFEYDLSQASFNAWSTSGQNWSGISLGFFSGTASWNMQFIIPGQALLQAGVYNNAGGRLADTSTWSSRPYLSITGNGTACNYTAGWFEILNASYDQSGKLVSFQANFQQNCDGNASPLFGTVRYQAH